MQYYSLNNSSNKVDFKQAAIAGQAPDMGLYFPESIPTFSNNLISNIESISNEAIAYEVIKPYIGNTIKDSQLKNIIAETINFEMPLVNISNNVAALELYHGPTLAFKDIGARFMSRCLGYFLKNSSKKVTVLVATSGDTGGAVANGFYNVPGVQVVVLYPSKKVSAVQEAQITTLGNNIKALEVNGNFDDCQQMVKQAFVDDNLRKNLFLTSANSINVARWLPQQFYYLFAYKQWKNKNIPPIFCVPSGNFGNICAGILAAKSGMPVQHFIAACNANKVIPNYFATQKYEPQAAISTISNAMDVGNPSNFVRVLKIFENQFATIKNAVSSYSITDNETKNCLKSVFENYNYLLDPHGAVAYAAFEQYLPNNPTSKGIILETAHPVKFNDTITEVIGKNILQRKEEDLLKNGTKQSFFIENNYSQLKDFLLQ